LTPATRFAYLLSFCLFPALAPLNAQTAAPQAKTPDAELKFVVILSRHGVRSPTAKVEQYNVYSAAPWPQWGVAPGYLTAHGYQLMKLFGAYDRTELASQGLLPSSGCEDADRVTIDADSDQRTRETGKALAEGLFPGCAIPVQARPEGVPDPLFHPVTAGAAPANSALSAAAPLSSAAIAGRIGGDPNNLTAAYHAQLAELDHILSTCGAQPSAPAARTSLFNIPAELPAAASGRLAELRGPLNTASTLSEILLLEYTQGMDASDVGWGCVDAAKLRTLMELHSAAEDFNDRTPALARIKASNLLNQIRIAFEQAATGKRVAGAVGKPSDRVLFLVGHDTNLANVAGLLNINWIADGLRDSTTPGGALVFELWRARGTGNYFVRTYFTTQTLEQMRFSTPLTLENPPQRVPVFLPGCGSANLSCPLPSFIQSIRNAINPNAQSAK
jgi:4-phytase/acid phosphatase